MMIFARVQTDSKCVNIFYLISAQINPLDKCDALRLGPSIVTLHTTSQLCLAYQKLTHINRNIKYAPFTVRRRPLVDNNSWGYKQRAVISSWDYLKCF